MDKNGLSEIEYEQVAAAIASSIEGEVTKDNKNTPQLHVDIDEDQPLDEPPSNPDEIVAELPTPHEDSTIMSPSIEPAYMTTAPPIAPTTPHPGSQYDHSERYAVAEGDYDYPREEESTPKRRGMFKNFGTKNLMSGISQSRFRKWTRTELIDLLITNDIELRDESNIAHVSLRDLCDALYEGLSMPEKIPPLTPEQKKLMDKYARIIQNSYIERLYRRRVQMEMEEYEAELEDQDNFIVDEGTDVDDIIASVESPASEDTGDIESGEPGAKAKSTKKKPVLMKALSARVVQALGSDWVAPSWQKAERTSDYLHPRKGGKGGQKFHMKDTTTGRHCTLNGFGEQCDLWQEGMVSEFSLFGPGVTNYFKFLKWLYWLFLMLSIISLPELIINIYGSSKSSGGLSGLSMTTVGNLANTVVNGTVSVPLPGCDGSVFGGETCSLNREKMGVFYSSLELTISLFVLIAFGWLWYFERREERKMDSMTLYTSQYSIAVGNLPEDVTAAEIRHHFNSLLTTDNDQVTIQVKGVVIAYDSYEHIRLLRKRGEILRKKTRRIHYHRYEATQVKYRLKSDAKRCEAVVEQLRAKFTEDCHKIDEELREVDKELDVIEQKKDRAVEAFVTFEHVVGAMIIKDLYTIKLADRLLRFFFPKYFREQKEHLLLRDKLLTVQRAPEPSTIIWEHLEASKLERLGRRMVTVFGAILLVVLSVLVTYGAKVLQTRAAEAGGTGLCPDNFDSLSYNEQLAEVSADSTTLHCFCDQFSQYRQQKIDECKHYATKHIEASVLTFFASFIVLVINSLIEYAIREFAVFEKHRSEDTKEHSIFLRLFILKYLNTSVVFLLNNNRVLRNVFGSTGADTNGFSATWYTSVGVTVLLVQIGNILTAQSNTGYEFVMYFLRLARAKASKSMCVTQSELNNVLLGPQFILAFRYSSLLSTMAVILTFNAGMPLLNLVAFFSFFVYYYVDKYMFIKLYRTPHRYNGEIGKIATMIIPVLVALHLGMAIWMLSDTDIFSSTVASDAVTASASNKIADNEVATRVQYKQTYPLYIFFCFLLALYVGYFLVRFLIQLAERIQIALHGDSRQKASIAKYVEEFKSNASPAFSRAVRRDVISGLSSFNILHNPIYKEAFGISWKFALSNSSLRCVRKATFVSGEDDDAIKAHATARLKYRSSRQLDTSGKASPGPGAYKVPAKSHSPISHGSKPRPKSVGFEIEMLTNAGIGKSAPGIVRVDSHFMRNKLVARQLEGNDDDLLPGEGFTQTPHGGHVGFEFADGEEDDDAVGSNAV